jgi:hypothetical protein
MHEAKVRSCLGVRFPKADVHRVLDLLAAFEQLPPEGVQDLITLLRR